MLVPTLIPKNIILILAFGNKFLNMIEGLLSTAEKNLPKNPKD